ncbi:CDP-alcohol phosphatidyltransferase family protein [Candidatus Babeliales bacterium]|nr:CDP-alcohol phosphatidyltransferase family protein [Candidatus Babeliales bacterium]
MKKSHSLLSKIYQDRRWVNVSNTLTFLRIVLAPVVALGVFYQAWYVTFFIFVLASVSDVLDGYCARLFNEKTALGEILDPIADKFFLLCCLGSLAFLATPSFYIPAWFVVLFCVRELIILVGTFILIRTNARFHIEPTIWGKLTTLFQLLFIAWIFICYFLQWAPAKTYMAVVVLLALFSALSLVQYMRIGMSYLCGFSRSDNDKI